jgi:hypothetical protein|tara:strand:+ start:637 stop:1104 length:468 start_codon:yes stop_codon:yes gene_type:complete
MSIIEKLKKLNITESANVILTYKEGCDVFVHNETAVDDAINYTDVISEFADLVATPGLKAEVPYCGNVLAVMREEGHLDDYERDGTFQEYIAAVITENFYDQEFIESSVEQYDYKRGYCTLETTVAVPFGNLIAAHPCIDNWTVSVPMENGVLTL